MQGTDSPRGKELLANWDESVSRFTRVLPAQYARVRAALTEYESKGLDLNAPGAWDEFLEVTGG